MVSFEGREFPKDVFGFGLFPLKSEVDSSEAPPSQITDDILPKT